MKSQQNNFFGNIKVALFSIWIFSLIACSCSVKQNSQSELEKKYGQDAFYYKGLLALKNEDFQKAKDFFSVASKNSFSLQARRSLENLYALESNSEKKESILRELQNKFDDEESEILLCKELFSLGKFKDILNILKSIDLTSSNNTLCRLYCQALYQTNSSAFKEAYITWCTSRQYSAEHSAFFSTSNFDDEYTALLNVRRNVYLRDYEVALRNVKNLSANTASNFPQVMSDIGKTLLYSSAQNQFSEEYLNRLEQSKNKQTEFYSSFYKARILERQKKAEEALSFYKKAFLASDSFSLSDNALWYYISCAAQINSERAFFILQEHRELLHDKHYFDDFFERFSVQLLREKNWALYYKTAKLIYNYASAEASARFCYTAARLLEEGIFVPQNANPVQETIEFYHQAMNSGTDLYYHFMSAAKLGIANSKESLELLLFKHLPHYSSDSVDAEAERLLQGYVDFSLPEKIYNEFLFFEPHISFECTTNLSSYLFLCAETDFSYYPKSLRIMAKKSGFRESYTSSAAELLFPCAYKTLVTDATKKNQLNEKVFYALIRSESFFDSQIKSAVGASGLTQLMNATASDVAKKLKLSDYDLTNAEQNIAMGSFYLAELIGRLDGSIINACFAYNGGIGRVRTWLGDSKKQFGQNGLPSDIFLEIFPFEETREYGRKITAAACMYGALYENTAPSVTIQEIMGK